MNPQDKHNHIHNFALRLATAMNDLKSSHAYFIVQKAFGEDLAWHDVEEIFKGIMSHCSCKKCRAIIKEVEKRFNE